MKIDSINVTSWATGQLMITTDGGTSIHIKLTEAESDQFRTLAIDLFTARQQEIAKDIADSRPALLADFTEVEPVPVPVDDDDIPF